MGASFLQCPHLCALDLGALSRYHEIYQGAKNSTNEGVPAKTVDSKLEGVSSLTEEAREAPMRERTGRMKVLICTILTA